MSEITCLTVVVLQWSGVQCVKNPTLGISKSKEFSYSHSSVLTTDVHRQTPPAGYSISDARCVK